MPVSRWKHVAAAGTEPVDSAELPSGRSISSMTATPTPASCAAIAAAQPQAPAPITKTSTSRCINVSRCSPFDSLASLGVNHQFKAVWRRQLWWACGALPSKGRSPPYPSSAGSAEGLASALSIGLDWLAASLPPARTEERVRRGGGASPRIAAISRSISSRCALSSTSRSRRCSVVSCFMSGPFRQIYPRRRKYQASGLPGSSLTRGYLGSGKRTIAPST